MRARSNRISTFLLCVVFCLGLLSVLAAPTRAAQVIRVGYPLQTGLTDIDAEGKYSGYSYEYLQEIAQYAGWEYEFLQLEGDINTVLSEMLVMLEQGELDLITGLGYSDQLAQIYDYPGHSYGTSYTVLRVLMDSPYGDSIPPNNTIPLRVATYGTTKGRSLQSLERYCDTNNILYELVRFETLTEMVTALEQGQADAILGTDISPISGTRAAAKFDPQPYYMATTKGNTALVSALDSAILRIEETDPSYSSKLYDKYFGPVYSGLSFSIDELSYLSTAGTLRVALNLSNAPFQFEDPESGTLQGISLDLLEIITQRTGLAFEFVTATTSTECVELLKAGQVDLISSLPYDYDIAASWGAALTRPYAIGQTVMVANNQLDPDDLSGKRLALASGSLNTISPNEQVLWYPTTEDCLAAISRGQADYTFGNSYTIQYYINHGRYPGISLVPQSSVENKVCLGVSKSQDPRLLSILNKVVISLSADELQALIYRHITNYSPVTFSDFLSANPEAIIGGIALAALLVVALLGYYFFLRNRRIRQAALDNERYRLLAELSNEYMFQYDYQADRLTLSEKSAQAFIPDAMQILEPYRQLLEERLHTLSDTLYSYLIRGQDLDVEVEMQFFAGNKAWTRILSRVVRDAGGNPVYAMGKMVDIQEDQAERERLIDRAQRDSLTGVYNSASSRSLIDQRMKAAVPGSRGALFVIDVDHFKEINDHLGHYTGDHVLTAIAGILAATFRQGDIVGRLGGDEFIIYMEDMGSRKTVEEKCRAILAQTADCLPSHPEERVTLSIGVATTDALAETFDVLYRQADQALYQVKNRGRNGFEVV